MPNYNGVWSITTQYQNASDWPKVPIAGDLALFLGNDKIDFITITSTGNATDFGDHIAGYAATSYSGGVSSSTRGVFLIGMTTGNADSNSMEFVTMRTKGNTTDFGDTQVAGRKNDTGSGSNTRGIFKDGGNDNNTISYITIATTGNASDFGDRTVNGHSLAGFSSTTRSVFAGGTTGSRINTIDYVTISSTGNATDFGDLTQVQSDCAGLSNSTRGIIAGGASSGLTNVISYVTIASTGNATDFGDCIAAKQFCSGTSNATRGVIALGEVVNIDFITIGSTGNATDFGDLSTNMSGAGAVSTAHGGLS
jgi:hypothetical protein